MVNRPNYTLGDKVICVRDHSQGFVTKGQVFTVIGMSIPCQCNEVWVNVGVKNNYDLTHCVHCKTITTGTWFSHHLFRKFQDPLQEQLENIEQVWKQEEEFVDLYN